MVFYEVQLLKKKEV